MKVLFIGGTGLISAACTALAVERGVDLFLLNRGNTPDRAAGATTLIADVHDEAAAAAALAGHRFDVVVDWMAFTPSDIERDVRLFRGRTDQFIFISSASAYQKPLGDWLIREDTPLANPFWEYSRNKIACEERLLRAFRDEDFPATIVRPTFTYGDIQIPLCMNSWRFPYTAIARMRAGKAVIVPGDGTSLWTLTHNTDFAKGLVGLLGQRQSIGHAFNIMSNEALTWDEITRQTAAAAGAEARIVHISSDFICACMPELEGTLTGDKAVTAVFDTSKIKRFVPDFQCTTKFAQGIRRSVAWLDADKSRQGIDAALDARWDLLISAYESGLANAKALLTKNG
jgi:nucleoside-diphosphate-sugar epimerase